MHLQLSPGLHERIPGIIFGTAIINDIHVRQKDERLWEQIEELIIIHAPAGSTVETIRAYTSLAGQRIVEYNGGQLSDMRILTA